jgi:hypothetical protein
MVPGEWGTRTVLVRSFAARSLSVSKYWVIEDEVHHVLRGGAGDCFGKILNGILQARNDGFALVGDAFALQPLGLRFRFGLFHQQQLAMVASQAQGNT